MREIQHDLHTRVANIKRSCRMIAWINVRNMDVWIFAYLKFRGEWNLKRFIHNWSLQPISQDYWLSFSLCVNFIHKWRDLQFKVDSERQIFWETFHDNFYILSELLTEICWEKIAEKILFVFCFDVWPGARTLALRLISQHSTY